MLHDINIIIHFCNLCLLVIIVCSDVSSIAEVILLCVSAIPLPLIDSTILGPQH